MDAPPASPGLNLRATIHIGASSMSMMIVEVRPDGSVEQIEFLEQPLPLARDIFRRGRVSRATTEHAVEILTGFQESLREAGAGDEHITRAVATNILSEAQNNEIFVNRLSIACGLRLQILDDGEMTRLIYLKTRRRLRDTPGMKKRNTLVVHVGPGNTRVLLFRKGRISRYTSYRLGTHRTAEAVESTHAEGIALLRVIREHISGQTSQIFYDFEGDGVRPLPQPHGRGLHAHRCRLLPGRRVRPPVDADVRRLKSVPNGIS
jgi:exopolyphosphatase/guanosine-5'-triphosphate,3'-diphosphate pyrophosphatase